MIRTHLVSDRTAGTIHDAYTCRSTQHPKHELFNDYEKISTNASLHNGYTLTKY